jgi:hypothetical protein
MKTRLDLKQMVIAFLVVLSAACTSTHTVPIDAALEEHAEKLDSPRGLTIESYKLLDETVVTGRATATRQGDSLHIQPCTPQQNGPAEPVVVSTGQLESLDVPEINPWKTAAAVVFVPPAIVLAVLCLPGVLSGR